jgi:glycerol-3-phosphate dehydrogenase
MEEHLTYIQEINIFYISKWNTAHQIEKELIDVIERYFEGIKNITEIQRLQYGVRPLIEEEKE